jgi:hypothetical protein
MCTYEQTLAAAHVTQECDGIHLKKLLDLLQPEHAMV